MNRHRTLVLSMTDEDYAEQLARQAGGCALCEARPKTRRLHWDHDHVTMEVRGLLCMRCNRALPSWVTVEWLQAAQGYLVSPPTSVLGRVMSSSRRAAKSLRSELRVVGVCSRCHPGETDPSRIVVSLVSPRGIVHEGREYGTTWCGRDATGAGWWWAL